MSKEIKSILLELASKSSAYGIPRLSKSKHLYQKIMWSLFILSSSLASFYLIRDAILAYLDFKVITISQNIYEQPTEFPTVSFCGYVANYFSNQKLSQILKECYFGYDSCTENYFEYFYSAIYGPCFRFNSGKNLKNQSTSIYNSTIGGVDDSFMIKLDKSIDLAIWIHNRSTPPNLVTRNSHYNNRMFISSNSYTEITIQKVIETKLGEPFNSCLNDVTQFKQNKTIIDYILKTNQTYSQQKCLELCFDLDYLSGNSCNCYNASLGNVWEYCWINLEKQSTNSCTWNMKTKFYSNSLTNKCSVYCPAECTSIYYTLQSSVMSNYNLTRLKIYYASLKYVSITQEPKIQLFDLISNIGGIFGLLIGFSFVTFFEIFEFFIEIFKKTNNIIKFRK